MKKADALEFAILGLLHDGPLHGYELRKRLSQTLGTLQAISFGSLYPALAGLVANGYITERSEGGSGRSGESTAAKRNRIEYRLTPSGKQRFNTLLADDGPNAWDDEGFRVRFAFFGRADADTRTSILEGRRLRLAERRALMREALRQARERVDAYTLELQRHGLEGVEREMRWLDDLIAAENRQQHQ